MGRIHAACFSDAALHAELTGRAAFWRQADFYGLDLTALAGPATDGYFAQARAYVPGVLGGEGGFEEGLDGGGRVWRVARVVVGGVAVWVPHHRTLGPPSFPPPSQPAIPRNPTQTPPKPHHNLTKTYQTLPSAPKTPQNPQTLATQVVVDAFDPSLLVTDCASLPLDFGALPEEARARGRGLRARAEGGEGFFGGGVTRGSPGPPQAIQCAPSLLLAALD